MSEADIRRFFSKWGAVEAVKCFRSKQSSQAGGATKGCGLVKMSTAEEAAAAIANLHMRFAWTPTLGPMVVRLIEPGGQYGRSGLLELGETVTGAPPRGGARLTVGLVWLGPARSHSRASSNGGGCGGRGGGRGAAAAAAVARAGLNPNPE